MTDPTPPVMTTPEEQRANTTRSLQILQKGAQTRKQKITASEIPWDVEAQPHNPGTVIPGTETGYRRNRFNPQTPGGQDYTTGTGYQDGNETVGYSKQDLEDIQKLLKEGKYEELEKKYGIDTAQLKTNGQIDPKKVQALQQTVDVLVINYDTAVDLSDDQAKADVFIDAFDKKNPTKSVPSTGSVTFRDRKNMTPADFQKLIDEAQRAEAGQPPLPNGNPNAALLVARIGKRNELTTTTFLTQQAVDAQLAKFMDVLIETSKQTGPLDEAKLKRFGQIFDLNTSPEELKKIADELKIPIQTIEQWRKDPETMKLGQGFTGALQDQHTRGDAANLYPDGDEACNNTISTKDLLSLKAGFLGQSPLKLPAGSTVNEGVYRQNIQTTVSDMRTQMTKQGYVRPDLPAGLPVSPNAPSTPYVPGSDGYYPGYSQPIGPQPAFKSSPLYTPMGDTSGGYPLQGYSSGYGPMSDYGAYDGGLYGARYGNYGSPYNSDLGDGSDLLLSPSTYGKGFNGSVYSPVGAY